MSRIRAKANAVKHWLLDAKKAVACAAGFAATATSLGLITSAQDAEITGIAGAVTTILVYVVDNLT